MNSAACTTLATQPPVGGVPPRDRTRIEAAGLVLYLLIAMVAILLFAILGLGVVRWRRLAAQSRARSAQRLQDPWAEAGQRAGTDRARHGQHDTGEPFQ